MIASPLPTARALHRSIQRRTRWLTLAGAMFAATLGVAREIVPLESEWRFAVGDDPGAQAMEFDAHAWRAVDLPHDWMIGLAKDPNATARGDGGYFPGGIGWYRKTFTAPESWRGQRVEIEFEGVYRNADVWINGTHLGNHPYGYTGFAFDLTPHLNLGGENLIAVRVDNSAQPNSRWYTGSGIYRPVRLVITSPVRIDRHGVSLATSQLLPDMADVQAEIVVLNAAEAEANVGVEVVIRDPAGREVAKVTEGGTVDGNGRLALAPPLNVPHPRLWSPESPELYHATTTVWMDDRMVDSVDTEFGLRTVKVSAERGFELNGKPLKIVGGSVHHDNGPLGAAAYLRAEERRVELMKAGGFNTIRTSHNPPSQAFLAACDRLGMLVVEEAFDGWEKAKKAHDYSVDFKAWAIRDVEEMVRAGRNHPAVVVWSVGNEMYERGNANGLRIARELTTRIREIDLTRPVTAAVNGPGKNGDWTKYEPLFATLDLAGYNYELTRHADDHRRVPNRVIISTESYQSETFANWNIARQVPYVIGDIVWSGLDYLGEAGIGRVFPPGEKIVKHWEGDQFPWHGAACGDIDLTGWRKPISHYRAIVWDRGESLYAAVLTPSGSDQPWGVSQWAMPPALPCWTWPGQEGKELTVEVYSRHEKVRLYLGDRRIGEKPTTAAEEFKASFVVPYAPGELRAVGVDGAKETATCGLRTAGPVATLRATADRTLIRGDGQDLAFVTLEAIDVSGGWNPTSDAPVRLAVSGPAEMVGIANADLTTAESYQANPHRLFQGRLLVVLRATQQRGEVTLTATSPGLKDGQLKLQVVAK